MHKGKTTTISAAAIDGFATESDLLSIAPEGWLLCTVNNVPYADLANDFDEVVEGARWSNLPRVPSIEIRGLPKNWSEFVSFDLMMLSEVKSRDIVWFALRCGNPETSETGLLASAFRIDWVGWKKVSISIKHLSPLVQHPAIAMSPVASLVGSGKLNTGSVWDRVPRSTKIVSGVYLFSKVWGRNPNPASALTFGAFGFSNSIGTEFNPPRRQTVNGVRVFGATYLSDSYSLNHTFPESAASGALTEAFRHEPYYKHERALLGYYPRFAPGPVSVCPAGKAYILGAGHLIQWVENGKWSWVDLLIPVTSHLAEKGHKLISIDNIGIAVESSLRWDDCGDVYVLVLAAGAKLGLPRNALLLHSADNMESWAVYDLPDHFYRFEKHTGQNTDCLRRPPVLLCDTNISYMILTSKKTDGSLDLSHRVTIAVPKFDAEGVQDCIGFNFHSGEANSVVSIGDDMFIAYARLNRPGNSAAAAYVQMYNRQTRQMNPSVFVGEGGTTNTDIHNWPALCTDPSNRLCVVVNGHHDSFTFTRSSEPANEVLWRTAEKVSAGTSYMGLVCDTQGTLFSVSRNSANGYRMKLTMHRKKSRMPWQQQDIVIPQKPYYKVWYHKLSINPITDHLYLSYFAISGELQDFADEIAAFKFRHPDLITRNRLKPAAGTDRTPAKLARRYGQYVVPPQEPVTLISKDHGDTWSLAVTQDFSSEVV